MAMTKFKISLKLRFRGAETVKITDFETLKSQKLISRKILVTGNLLKLNTV